MSAARMKALEHRFDPDLKTYIEAAINVRVQSVEGRVYAMRSKLDAQAEQIRALTSRIAELEAQDKTVDSRQIELAANRISKASLARIMAKED